MESNRLCCRCRNGFYLEDWLLATNDAQMYCPTCRTINAIEKSNSVVELSAYKQRKMIRDEINKQRHLQEIADKFGVPGPYDKIQESTEEVKPKKRKRTKKNTYTEEEYAEILRVQEENRKLERNRKIALWTVISAIVVAVLVGILPSVIDFVYENRLWFVIFGGLTFILLIKAWFETVFE